MERMHLGFIFPGQSASIDIGHVQVPYRADSHQQIKHIPESTPFSSELHISIVSELSNRPLVAVSRAE